MKRNHVVLHCVLFIVTFWTSACSAMGTDFYYLKSGPVITNLREEHDLIRIGGWRNFSFSESFHYQIKDTIRWRKYSYPTPSGWFPGRDNFHLIAQSLTTGEFVECTVFPKSDLAEAVQVNNPVGPGFVFSVETIGFSYQHVGTSNKVDTVWKYFLSDVTRNAELVAALPEDDTLLLYYGSDYISAVEWNDTLNIGGTGFDNVGLQWDSWEDYLTDPAGAGHGMWTTVGPIYVHGPPAPIDGSEIHFNGYLSISATGDTINGRDWIPDPDNDSLIGLKFSFTNPDCTVAHQPVYQIWAVSTWQGKNMNMPYNDIIPRAVGDSTFFDFQVLNPLIGGNLKYTITTTDRDIVIDDLGNGWGNDAAIRGNKLSIRRYTVVRNADVEEDELWLKAKDYGAHAIVQPHVDGYQRMRLTGYDSPYYDAPLWCVSAPRDDDGEQVGGVNYGDFMADAWEEKVLNVARYDTTILDFLPFFEPPFDTTDLADTDFLPAGRKIDGDRFVNWEEYRGFSVVGGLDSAHYSKKKIARLNPKRKEVFVAWQEERADTAVKRNIPAWLKLMRNATYDTLNVFYTDLLIDTAKRFTNEERFINVNQVGAYFPYFTVPFITNTPMGLGWHQNVVSYWKFIREEQDPINRVRVNWDSTLAYRSPKIRLDQIQSKLHQVPEYTSRIVVISKNIDKWRDSTYYSNPLNTPFWAAVRDSMYQLVMTHEFGHSVGMTDPVGQLSPGIMNFAPVYPIQGLNHGRFFWAAPFWAPSFSDTTMKQRTVRVDK